MTNADFSPGQPLAPQPQEPVRVWDFPVGVNSVSDLFDGKATLAQVSQRLQTLGASIAQQVKAGAAKAEALLGPQATAAIDAGLANIAQAGGAAVILLDDDLAPYMAAGAKAVEGAVDTVMDAAIPGGAALNPLVNGGIDTIAGGLKAAIDAQAAAWKGRLAAAAPQAPAA
ncbi:MAG TPA: hypothetical protein VGL58_06375 [Caulobacteraceae bacterium]